MRIAVIFVCILIGIANAIKEEIEWRRDLKKSNKALKFALKNADAYIIDMEEKNG